MADLEPSELFAHDVPSPLAFLDADEIERNFRALVQNNFTTSADRPAVPKEGMARVRQTSDTTASLEIYFNGSWRVAVPNLGISAPTSRQIVTIDTPLASWVIDHNMGLQPLVQAFDENWNLIPNAHSGGLATEPWLAGDLVVSPAGSILTRQNKDMTPAATVGNEQPTGLTVAVTPRLDSHLAVYVQHIRVRVGNGVKTKECYFSPDGGTTARAVADIVAGDELIWNGIIAGFDLAGTEWVEFDYVEAGSTTGITPPVQTGGFVAPWPGLIVGAYAVVTDALTGAPALTIVPTINGTPTTGGVLTVNGAQAIGAVAQSTAVTATNKFTAGQSVQLRLQAGSVMQSGGSVKLFLLVQRSDHCLIQHISGNRVTITHPEARTGYAVLVG